MCFIFFFFLLVILSSSPLSLHHPAPHWKAGCQSHLYSPIHKMCFSVASLVFFSCSTGFKQCDYNFLQHCFLFALCAGVPWNSWNIFHSFFGICIIFQDYYFFFLLGHSELFYRSVLLFTFFYPSLCVSFWIVYCWQIQFKSSSIFFVISNLPLILLTASFLNHSQYRFHAIILIRVLFNLSCWQLPFLIWPTYS